MKRKKEYTLAKFKSEFEQLYTACKDVLEKVSGSERWHIRTSDKNTLKKFDRFMAKTDGTMWRDKVLLHFHKEPDGVTVATNEYALSKGDRRHFDIEIAA